MLGILAFIPLPDFPATGFYETFETIYGDEIADKNLKYLAFDETSLPIGYRPYFNTLMRQYCRRNHMRYLIATYDELKEDGYIIDGGFQNGVILHFHNISMTGNDNISGEISIYSGSLSATGRDFFTQYDDGWIVNTSNSFWIS